MQCTGKERDAETGLDYFGARYFASGRGRFGVPDLPLIDQDALYPQSWNLYVYVRNNPLRFVDPTGERCRIGTDGKQYDDDQPGQTCAQVDADDANRKPSATVTASGSQALTDEEKEQVVRDMRFQLSSRAVSQNLKLPSKDKTESIAAWRPRKTWPIDETICFTAPSFLLENRALFGLRPASGPPPDPMLGNGPGPYWQPTGRTKNGGYGQVGASTEVRSMAITDLANSVLNSARCIAAVRGN